jgi:hypothetical protein
MKCCHFDCIRGNALKGTAPEFRSYSQSGSSLGLDVLSTVPRRNEQASLVASCLCGSRCKCYGHEKCHLILSAGVPVALPLHQRTILLPVALKDAGEFALRRHSRSGMTMEFMSVHQAENCVPWSKIPGPAPSQSEEYARPAVTPHVMRPFQDRRVVSFDSRKNLNQTG